LLRAAFSLLAVLSCAAPSFAQSPPPTPHVELPLQSTEGVPTTLESPQTRAALDEANAKAAAAMDAFDQRITERAHRVLSSICDRCLPSAQGIKPLSQPVEAVASSGTLRIRDPKQAAAGKGRPQLGSAGTRTEHHLASQAKKPTTGDLLKANAIASNEVDAAVDAALAQPGVGHYPIGGGYLLDLDAAIKAHKPLQAKLTDLHRPEKLKREIVRTAILLARPEKI
jgi:cell division septation protein DedD